MKSFVDIFNKHRIIRHLVFWLVYLAISILMYGYSKGDYIFQLKQHLLYLPAILLAAYFTIELLIPRFLFQKKTLKFSILFLITAFLFSFLQRLNLYYIVIPLFYPKYLDSFNLLSFQLIFRVFSEYPVVILAASIKIILHWYREQQINQKLVREKLEAELKFLKAQIHPHFLFNTLNNLYALTLKKSSQAPEVVLKISELLNYMLYESNVEEVSLKKETEHIKNYIALEKIRYGKKLKLNFNITGSTENMRIAPMLLLPFVENSFKHGVSKKITDKWINISLKSDSGKMILFIENSKSNDDAERESEYTAGIGLKNVRRRLDLLYAGKYNLTTTDSGGKYTVNLEIDLSHKTAEYTNEN